MLAVPFLLVAATWVLADTVRLANGNSLKGVIIRENEGEVVLRMTFGVVRVPRSDIKSIARDKSDLPAANPNHPLAGWQRCAMLAAREYWGSSLGAIPATVIDNGILKNVPYKSFRSVRSRDQHLRRSGQAGMHRSWCSWRGSKTRGCETELP